MIYFRDSYILIMFFLLPYDQSCVSSHSCLDTQSLSVDNLPKDEKFSFVRILELYLQGRFSPPECPWSKSVDSNYSPADCKFWIWCQQREEGTAANVRTTWFPVRLQSVLYDILCSLLRDVLQREKKGCMFLLWQVMNNQGVGVGDWWKISFGFERQKRLEL